MASPLLRTALELGKGWKWQQINFPPNTCKAHFKASWAQNVCEWAQWDEHFLKWEPGLLTSEYTVMFCLKGE